MIEPFPPRFCRWWRPIHRVALVPLLQVLFPAGCLGCGHPLGAIHLLGACLQCWALLTPVTVPRCVGCAGELAAATDLLGPAGGRCWSCLTHPRAFSSAVTAVLYTGMARRFLLRAKLEGRIELFGPMGRQLASAIRNSPIDGAPTIVPVPSHPWRRLRRGFDPAQELARVAGKRLGWPVARLLRRRWSSVQAVKRLGAARRRERMDGAFVARGGVRHARLVLIDDVLTSGATAQACTRTLLAAGAATVSVATWSRTPRSATITERMLDRAPNHG